METHFRSILLISLIVFSAAIIPSHGTQPVCQIQTEASKIYGSLETRVESLQKLVTDTIKAELHEISTSLNLVQNLTVGGNVCKENGDKTYPPCPRTANLMYPTEALLHTVTDLKSLSYLPNDCFGYLERGFNKSGIYRVFPSQIKETPIDVYCDMETAGGGWMVVQRRGEFSEPVVNFGQNWTEYKKGFGNITQEFWIGNDNLYALTNQKKVSLRIDMQDFEGYKRYAMYEAFVVAPEESKYLATFVGYVGDAAGDSMGGRSHNVHFSTFDRDNDGQSSVHCADKYKSGWWFSSTGCFYANLNGKYYNQGQHANVTAENGIHWKSWKGTKYSLKSVEMKIRPKYFKRIP